jgi:hypothetical protein
VRQRSDLAATARAFAADAGDALSRATQVDYLARSARFELAPLRLAMVALLDEPDEHYQGGLMLLYDAYELARRSPPVAAERPSAGRWAS